jgi:hypothetical protein
MEPQLANHLVDIEWQFQLGYFGDMFGNLMK